MGDPGGLQLYNRLHDDDFRLDVQTDRLRVSPASKLTAELRVESSHTRMR